MYEFLEDVDGERVLALVLTPASSPCGLGTTPTSRGRAARTSLSGWCYVKERKEGKGQHALGEVGGEHKRRRVLVG